jgi:transcription termination factor NusB
MIDNPHDIESDESVDTEEVAQNVGLIRKQTARIAAVQSLFAKMVHPENTADELMDWQQQLLQEESEEKGKKRKMNRPLFRSIFIGTMDMFGALNERLSEILKEDWTGGRMPRIMRCVLLCAAYEMIYTPKLRYSIILQEYTIIASLFMDEKDVGFVYASLRKCGDTIRAGEAHILVQTSPHEEE